jgi:hypothetical protein
MEAERYEFQTEDNQLVAVRRIVGDDKYDVTMSGDDQLFCNALTWASKNKNEFVEAQLAHLARSPQAEYFCFFCDAKELASDLKRRSCFLYAETPPDPSQTRVGSVGQFTLNIRGNSSLGEQNFFQLARVEPEKDRFGIGNPLPILISQRLYIDLTNQLSKKTDGDYNLECLFCRQVERTFVYVGLARQSKRGTIRESTWRRVCALETGISLFFKILRRRPTLRHILPT